jgi:hypothetical protein|eukprot:COSAG05_NODE_6982_length_871_cov_1.067358_1_plen_151_part_00
MTKGNLFKTVSTVHIESIANATWSSFAILDKMQDSFSSAYIEKVRISFVLNEEETEPNTGLLFVSSLDNTLSATASANDGQIISATATRGGGGVVVLPIQRSIRNNASVSNSSQAGDPIYLHARAANIGETTAVYMVIETWGRWHKVESL